MFPHCWLCAQAALLRICQPRINQADLGVAHSAECLIHPLLFFCLVNPYFFPLRHQPWLCLGSHEMMGPVLASLCRLLELGVSTMGCNGMLHPPSPATQSALPVPWTWSNAGSGYVEQHGGHRGGHAGSFQLCCWYSWPLNCSMSRSGRPRPDIVFLASYSGRTCRETFGAD